MIPLLQPRWDMEVPNFNGSVYQAFKGYRQQCCMIMYEIKREEQY